MSQRLFKIIKNYTDKNDYTFSDLKDPRQKMKAQRLYNL